MMVCPRKFCISIVCVFSWDPCKALEKLETMLLQNLKGQTKSIMVFFEVVYSGRAKLDYSSKNALFLEERLEKCSIVSP